jgi:NTE family protein
MARALVLTAGGITGAMYEVGVLRAVEERHGSPIDLFDLFVGVSAGATVASFLAQGVPASRAS